MLGAYALAIGKNILKYQKTSEQKIRTYVSTFYVRIPSFVET